MSALRCNVLVTESKVNMSRSWRQLRHPWDDKGQDCGTASKITVSAENHEATGGLVLIGNGRLYGGDFRIFPTADLHDGLLDVCVFPRVTWLTLAYCGPYLLLRGTLPPGVAVSFRARSFSLTSATLAPLEIDGELVGHLPATFSVAPSGLRVIVP